MLQQAHKSLSMRICGRRMHSYVAVVNWGGAVVVAVVAAAAAAACCPCFVKRLMQQNGAAGQVSHAGQKSERAPKTLLT